jgi:putative protease
VIEAKPDAIIMSDPGLIMMVRDRWPDQEVHLSVQANVVNSAAVKFWERMGLTRVILSRELSLEEVEQIALECPSMEIETFVHGALCMAYSGRCLLSGYMNHRDPNQGTCTNACRWKYKVHEGKSDDFGTVNADRDVEPQLGIGTPLKGEYLLEDVTRPGKMMPIMEDETGTQILNSKDLRAIQHVEHLIKIGVCCFKIEGRTKSFFYAARTAQLYRKAIDDALAGRPFDMSLMDALEGLSTRGYTEGFYRRHVHDEYQAYDERLPSSATQKFVGEIIDYDAQKGLATVDVKNHFAVGDDIEIMLPGGNQRMKLSNLEDKDGNATQVAPGSGHVVKVPLETTAEEASKGLVIQHTA